MLVETELEYQAIIKPMLDYYNIKIETERGLVNGTKQEYLSIKGKIEGAEIDISIPKNLSSLRDVQQILTYAFIDLLLEEEEVNHG